MKLRKSFYVFVVVIVSCVAASWVRWGAGAQAPSASKREDAYRANNLGVALLEQFKHKEGADQFRRALALDPQLSLARTNLAIALYNVPDLEAAQREAQAAAASAPDSPRPHYVLGLIARQQSRTEAAVAAFQRVLKVDPRDVGANVQLGQLYAQQRNYTEAVAAFRVALAEEPYNGTALYNLGTALLRAGQREEGQRLVQQFQALRQSGAATTIGQNYLEQGRYAEAVASTGAEPGLVEKSVPEVSFADATEAAALDAPAASDAPALAALFGASFEAKDWEAARLHVLTRLACASVLFDFDDDSDLDLFEARAGGRRLLRNEGAGKFADATGASGALKDSPPRLATAAAAGDYDNDGRPDLLLVEEGRVALYRGEGAGRFSKPLTFDYPHAAASAALVDADHDGDLDLFVAGLADLSAAPASYKPGARLNFPSDFGPAPDLLLRNNGDGTFADATAAAKFSAGARAVAVIPTDYDNRRDVDLLVVNYGAAPRLYRNLRDGSFRDVAAEVGLDARANFTSAAAGDVNKDEFTDFFLGAADAPGLFAVSDGRGRFVVRPAPAATSGATAAQFFDYDNDGLLDLVAVTAGGLRVLRNVGDNWADVSERAAADRRLASAGAARALAAGDVDADGDTDLFVSGAGGLRFARNDGGSRNPSLRVRLAGKVSNRVGVGAKVEVRAGSLSQKLETYAASPAPAPADLLFGLGARARADAVRVLWPSGVVQAETELAPAAAGGAAAKAAATLPVTELDRKPSSCPYLYAWNGERFEFVTDFMGGGELGYWAAPGVRAAPDPDEYVRIRGDQLKERGGRYELRVTNELEEALFVDRLQLLAVAHPAEVEVHPNEGLGNPTSARLRLYAARAPRPPRAAADDHGRDLLPSLSRLDRHYAEGFKLLPLRGYAEEHGLVLDLGTASGRRDGRKGGRTLLLMTGWTDYAFSSDNVAAAQRGLALKAPALQVRDARGRWRTVIPDIGIPVGRPQTVVVDLTNKFLSASREVRVVTNMRVYWDQVLVDDSEGETPLKVERLEASTADLRWRGFSAQVTPDGREPFTYDYARVTDLSPWKVFTGRYTRFGDVRELLTGADDMFVVSRPGDELALSFDASALAPLPPGWTRTFLLYADGYSKEMDINSASPHEVAPLPFKGMKSYPYAAPDSYPAGAAHAAYLERYNTRVVNSPLPRLLAAGP